MTLLLALLAAVAVPPSARASGSETLTLAPGVSQTVRYHVSSTFHDVTGTTHALTGRALVLPDGEVEAEVEAPVRSFDSGNGTRDRNAMGAVDAERYPEVVVKAFLPALPAQGGRAVAKIRVTLDGQTRDLSAPVDVEWQAGGRIHVTGGFTVLLSDFHVKRPELFLIPISDAVPIDVDLTWSGVPPA
jgi:polyisoprenoid-binding protein YceI